MTSEVGSSSKFAEHSKLFANFANLAQKRSLKFKEKCMTRCIQNPGRQKLLSSAMDFQIYVENIT